VILNRDSFAEATVDYENSPLRFAFDLSPTPEGRAPDLPPAFTTGYMAPNSEGLGYIHFPLDALQHKMEEVLPIIVQCMKSGPGCGNGYLYILGGAIPNVDDGMNALPSHRRHNAFITNIFDVEIRHALEKVFYGVEDGVPVTGDVFPGSLCHNHAPPHSVTPLKNDWTRLCDPEWTEEKKAEECFSYHEAAFGTENLKKLEGIHATVDPLHLFNCWDCVGYGDLPGDGTSGPDVPKSPKASKRPKASRNPKAKVKKEGKKKDL